MAATGNRNREIYDARWMAWRDMKLYGPASVWLRGLIATALESLDPIRVASILDVGCGEGTTTDMLARKFPQARVTGIDFSETGIAMASESYGSPRVTFHADTASKQLDEARFELVTCFEVLEHVDDWQSLLHRICGAASYAVALSFPTGRMRPYEAHVGHVRNFRQGEVEAFMGEAGFAVARRFQAGFPFFSPIYRDLCNLVDAGSGDFSTGRFGVRQRIVAAILLTMFRRFSLRSVGDQFCGVFVRAAP
jgi:SAM-dependent methyltransferase